MNTTGTIDCEWCVAGTASTACVNLEWLGSDLTFHRPCKRCYTKSVNVHTRVLWPSLKPTNHFMTWSLILKELGDIAKYVCTDCHQMEVRQTKYTVHVYSSVILSMTTPVGLIIHYSRPINDVQATCNMVKEATLTSPCQ